MKRILVLSGVLLLALCFNSMENGVNASESNLAQANNEFGLKLFREISLDAGNENIFISPFSISMALDLTLNGAKDSTYNEMLNTLELKGISLDDINRSNQQLMKMISGLDSSVIVEIANSIWYQDTFPVLNSFTELNKTYYDAEINQFDFTQPDAAKLINKWVDKTTHGKIKKIVEPPISRDAVMFLINAIYFKGNWQSQFDRGESKVDWFILPNDAKEECIMMNQDNEYQYFENDQFQAAEIPYGQGQYSMVVFLPKTKKNDDLNSLTDKFTEENWSNWSSEFSKAKVKLSLPKFKLEYGIKLNKTLIKLGMPMAFDGAKANFKNMYDTTMCRDNIYIDEVMHKTFVDVNEKGTEAAAVTKVGMARMAAAEPRLKQVVMRVDHPFIFAIKDNSSNSILFIGKIVNPGLYD